MLLRPSYLELMAKLNECNEGENKIDSSYAVVVIIAKCARQINKDKKFDEDNKFININMRNNSDVKAISVAIKDLLGGKVKIMASLN